MNIIDFVKDTYEQSITTKTGSCNERKRNANDEMHQDNDTNVNQRLNELDQMQEESKRIVGRPNHKHSLYLENHPMYERTYRVIRPENHKTLIDVVGKFFPRPNDETRPDYFKACMIALLKPWRSLHSLKEDKQTWTDAFDQLQRESNENALRYLSNITYYHKSREASRNNKYGNPISENQHTSVQDMHSRFKQKCSNLDAENDTTFDDPEETDKMMKGKLLGFLKRKYQS